MTAKKNIKLKSWTLAMLLLLAVTGCKKFLVVEPPDTSVNEENVYQSDATAIAVLTGMYANMASYEPFSGKNNISILPALSADELTLASVVTDNTLTAYYRNELRSTPTENYGTQFWQPLYNFIFTCNAAIEGLDKSQSLSPSVKTQLLGEAKFMRAFFYFYLVNFYGDVPLALVTNPLSNAGLPRSSKANVYDQVINDLKQAQQLLSENYLDKDLHNYAGAGERVRPTKWAAAALLARTYLYTGQYNEAEAEASKVIGNSVQFSLVPINNVFLKNSSEAIWQLQPVMSQRNTEDAFTFILPPSGPNANTNPVYISFQLIDAFEPGDVRRKGSNWIDSVVSNGNVYFYPLKYKAKTATGSVSEYTMVLRLAEQYLIRAEARAQLNDTSGSQADLNVIRTRAGLANTTANDQASLLTAILKERQAELFTEYGQRWFDLKRTGNIDQTMSNLTPTKGSNWQSYQQLYPVLYNDLLKDHNLTQNPGY